MNLDSLMQNVTGIATSILDVVAENITQPFLENTTDTYTTTHSIVSPSTESRFNDFSFTLNEKQNYYNMVFGSGLIVGSSGVIGIIGLGAIGCVLLYYCRSNNEEGHADQGHNAELLAQNDVSVDIA
jgi:hypothetical protein